MSIEEINATPSLTDWKRLEEMDDADITRAAEADPDAQPLSDDFFETVRRVPPEKLLKNKQQITLRIDAEVLDWFRSLGAGYQSRMNEVLKIYYGAHQK